MRLFLSGGRRVDGHEILLHALQRQAQHLGELTEHESQGLILKTALALRRKVLPPQISAGRSADQVSNLASSAYLLDSERPWITGDSANPRRAAVLGANFDAVNPVGEASPAGRAAAVILEEEPEDRT